MEFVLLEDFVEELCPVFEEAGDIALDLRKKGLKIEYKEECGRKSIVTNADLAADRHITEKVKHIYSSLIEKYDLKLKFSIISEEGDKLIQSDSKHTIGIDPIDGSNGFSKGWNSFTIQADVTNASTREILAAAIYKPFGDDKPFGQESEKRKRKEFITTVLGKGARMHGNYIDNGEKFDQRIYVSKTTALPDSLIVTNKFKTNVSGQVLQQTIKDLLYEAVYQVSEHVITVPSTGNRFALVAKGVAEAFIFPPYQTNSWDVNPGILTVREAGGVVTDFLGRENMQYDMGFIAVNSRELHTAILDELKRNLLLKNIKLEDILNIE